MTDDAELLRRYARENSESAFAELVRRRIGLVYSVARRRTGNSQLAEDVTQVVFAGLARKAAILACRPALIGWLYRSAQFAASDAMRAECRRKAKEKEGTIMEELGQTALDPNWQEIRPMIDDLVNGLNERDRDAVLLRFLDDRPFVEIGLRLGLSENAARMRVDRALGKMRAALARRGMTSTAGALAAALVNQATATVPPGLAATVAGTAVAGATAASGATATTAILNLMTTTKLGAGIAGLAAILAIGSAVYEARTARVSAAALAGIASERGTSLARTAALEKPGRSAVHGANAVMPALQLDPSRAWQAPSPLGFALEHPEARAAFVRLQVTRAMAHFDRFFKAAHVSDHQQQLISKQLNDLAEGMVGYDEAVRAQGFGPMSPPQDPLVLAEILKMESDVYAGPMYTIRAVLGDVTFKQFLDYKNAIPDSNVADELAGRLYQSDTPLTSVQAAQLMQILKANPYQAGSTPTPANTLDGTYVPSSGAAGAISNLVNGDLAIPGLSSKATITDAAMSRAADMLSPAQLAELRQMQAEQAAQLLLAPPSPPQPTAAQAMEAYRRAHPGK